MPAFHLLSHQTCQNITHTLDDIQYSCLKVPNTDVTFWMGFYFRPYNRIKCAPQSAVVIVSIFCWHVFNCGYERGLSFNDQLVFLSPPQRPITVVYAVQKLDLLHLSQLMYQIDYKSCYVSMICHMLSLSVFLISLFFFFFSLSFCIFSIILIYTSLNLWQLKI